MSWYSRTYVVNTAQCKLHKPWFAASLKDVKMPKRQKDRSQADKARAACLHPWQLDWKRGKTHCFMRPSWGTEGHNLEASPTIRTQPSSSMFLLPSVLCFNKNMKSKKFFFLLVYINYIFYMQSKTIPLHSVYSRQAKKSDIHALNNLQKSESALGRKRPTRIKTNNR